MWLNELYRHWAGPMQTNRRARRTAARRRKRPTLEALEDRTLLSAPDPFTVSGVKAAASQFDGGGNIHKTAFIGGTFNTSQKAGGIATTSFAGFQYGASAFFKMNGSVGLGLYANVGAGTISANYGSMTLQQNQNVEPTSFGQEVNFTPQNTYVSYSGGKLSTKSPYANAGATLEANVNATVGGRVGYGAGTSKGSKQFTINNFNQPIAAYTTKGALSLFGQPITSIQTNIGTPLDQYVNSSGIPLSASVSIPPVSIPIVEVPPLSVDADVGLNGFPPTGLQESLNVSAGLPNGASVSENLATASQSIPTLAPLSSSSLQTINNIPGSLQAASPVTGPSPGGNTFFTIGIQGGPLLAALLDFPMNPSGLATTWSIGVGNFGSVEFTPASFTLNPGLSLEQTATITPQNTLTYRFFNQATGNAMKVDVTETVPNPTSGQPPITTDLGKVSSVTFTPGVDSIGVRFTGTPIEVQPTWHYGTMEATNDVYLAADLTGTLTIGQVTVNVGTLSTTLGPAFQQTYTWFNQNVATFYDKTFQIGKSTSATLPSFVIGDAFTPSLQVNTTADNNTPYISGNAGSSSLRAAVESANLNYQNGTTGVQVIHLGPGTYNLTIPPTTGSAVTGNDDGTTGDLNVDSNVEILGAGLGQTIINASGLGDRLFNVAAGGNLTLAGVTLENGSGPSADQFFQGGGIYNAGKLTFINSALNDCSAATGGGIYNAASGRATIIDSTLADNSATEEGGGVFNLGTLLVSNSTFATNSATNLTNEGSDGGGGIFNDGTATITDSTFYDNSVPYGSGGGGIYNAGTLSLSDSTLYGNTAFQAGGGLYQSSAGTASLINDTLTQNIANYLGIYPNGQQYTLGGGIYVAGGGTPPKLANTIVADNYNSNNETFADDIDGSVDTVSSLSNLIGTGGSGGLTNGQNGNQVGVANALLGTLGNYGGPTETVPLLAGSPASDAGNNAEFNSATDQRGYARVVNGGNATAVNAVDIGAFEYGAVSSDTDLALTGSASSTSVIPGEQITYTLILTNQGSKRQTDMTLFDTLPVNTTLVSWTAPNGWESGLGLPYGASNETVYAWSNNRALNPGASVTFTLVLQVDSGTALGTVLSNTASVGPLTGDPKPRNNTVTLQASVKPVNVTGQLLISPQFPLNVDQQNGEYFTTVYVTDNNGNMNGPLGLVITGLPAGVTMVNATGTYQGNPYLEIVPANGSLIDHQTQSFLVTFKTTGAPITTFRTYVWQGL